MPVNKSLNQIREDLQKQINEAGEFWLERQPAEMGNHSGVVKVPGKSSMVYVRLANGQVIEVYNNLAPNIYNWKVYVGRDKSQPSLIRVIEVRLVHNLAQTVAYVLFHHEQHEYPAPDTVWVRRDQLLPLLVLPAGGFNVRLYGDVIYAAGMSAPLKVDNVETIDLSSHFMLTGAKYVLMEIDSTGTPNYVTGDTYTDIAELRDIGVMPTPTAGSFPICVIEFYAGQTEIRRDSTERNIIDLRMFVSNVEVDPATQWHTSAAVTTLADGDELGVWEAATEVLKKITWANIKAVLTTYFDTLYSAIAHTHGYLPDTATYTDISTNDTDTDVTGAELEELTDGSETTLHSHAGGGGGGHTIQEEGTPLTARANLNFTGADIIATDDAGNNATVVTVEITSIDGGDATTY